MDPAEEPQTQAQQTQQAAGPFSSRARQASDGARRVFVYAARRQSFASRLAAWSLIALALIILLLLIIPALLLGLIAALFAAIYTSIARLVRRTPEPNQGRRNVRVIRRQ